MKTLEEHNRERMEQYKQELNGPIKNGIICPACARELYDALPMITLASNPPKKEIYCGWCEYRGYRIA